MIGEGRNNASRADQRDQADEESFTATAAPSDGLQLITDWKAKRSGGRITITGKTGGQEVKVANVDEINVSDSGGPIATDKNGTNYRLSAL